MKTLSMPIGDPTSSPVPGHVPGRARWAGWLVLAAASLLSACGGGEPTAEEAAAVCRAQVNDTADKLLGCVTLEGVQAHQRALDAVARAHGGHRMAGSAGDEASVAYVSQALTDAGYRVVRQPFEFRTFKALTPSVLMQSAPWTEGIPSRVFEFSGSGSVTAAVSAPVVPTGCAATDFAGFVPGHLALVQRGGCDFLTKATHAVQAGATGVIFHNHQAGVLQGNLGEGFLPEVPVVGVSQEVGALLAARIPTGLTLQLTTQTERRTAITHNVLADLPGSDPNHITVLGAHLDSVEGTGGMNDNASGVAALLETALQMARVQPRNTLRFAFWGAEEAGLLGSTHHVAALSAAEKARIDLYLNFDMLASTNHVFFTYTGQGEAVEGVPARADATAAIESALTAVYRQRGLPYKPIADTGQSDHVPFGLNGIPFGGLFTGADEVKTAEEMALWGGTAGEPLDACYHQACDDLAHINTVALEANADTLAHAALHFAMNRLPR